MKESTPTSLRVSEPAQNDGRTRLRVLFVTDVDLSGPSGQNVATRELVGALAHRDDVELWVACPRSDDPLLAGLWEAIDSTLFLPRKKTRSVWWGVLVQAVLFRQLWLALREKSFDVIVARRGPSLLLPPLFARAFRVRYILLQRGIRPDVQRSFWEIALAIPLRVIGLLNIRCADQVFVAYQEVKEQIDRDRLPGQRESTLLTNAVDPSKFEPLTIQAARSRLPHLGLRADDLVIGFVGSFQERHAVDVLVRALTLVKSAYPEAKLLAVGDGPMRTNLVSIAKRLGVADAVIFPGSVPYEDVSVYMAASDALAAVVDTGWPSNPIKVYEYLASCRPVVTSARPEFTFIEQKSFGRLAKSNDAHDFAAALIEILDLSAAERLQMGEAARAYVKRHHTWKQFTDAILM